jgi:hypothetical protein
MFVMSYPVPVVFRGREFGGNTKKECPEEAIGPIWGSIKGTSVR